MIKLEARDLIRQKLNEARVGTSINYPKAPILRGIRISGTHSQGLPNAYHDQSRILSLPIYPEITASQQQYVVETIKAAIG